MHWQDDLLSQRIKCLNTLTRKPNSGVMELFSFSLKWVPRSRSLAWSATCTNSLSPIPFCLPWAWVQSARGERSGICMGAAIGCMVISSLAALHLRLMFALRGGPILAPTGSAIVTLTERGIGGRWDVATACWPEKITAMFSFVGRWYPVLIQLKDSELVSSDWRLSWHAKVVAHRS